MSDRTRKLESIRHHTDHDLQVLVGRELDRAFSLLDVVITRSSPLLAQAEKAYDTANMILPRISGLSDGERLQVESRLKDLRSQLDQAATFAKVAPYSVAVAS